MWITYWLEYRYPWAACHWNTHPGRRSTWCLPCTVHRWSNRLHSTPLCDRPRKLQCSLLKILKLIKIWLSLTICSLKLTVCIIGLGRLLLVLGFGRSHFLGGARLLCGGRSGFCGGASGRSLGLWLWFWFWSGARCGGSLCGASGGHRGGGPLRGSGASSGCGFRRCCCSHSSGILAG